MNRLLGLLALAFLVSACDSASSDAALNDSGVTSNAMMAGPSAALSADPATVDGMTASPVSRHIVASSRGLSSSARRAIEAAGGTIVFTHSTGVTLVDGLSDAAAASIASVRGVDEVIADVNLDRTPEDPGVEAIEASLDSPADAFFYGLGYQWHMDAINAPAAWAAGRTGSPDVTVAIIDSGLDDQHLDLRGRVDASRSISLLPAGELDYLIRDVLFPGRPDWSDFNTHGTHVGATAVSNGVVGAGVTENATLMAVKVCRYNNSCSGGAILAGVLHAADNGADVANMSLGGSFDRNLSGAGGFIGLINRVFNYADRQGMLVVVSAGNSAIDLDNDGPGYKTYCNTPSAFCVSATGPQSTADIRVGPFFDIDAPASYTNYGRSAVDVAAPGGDSNGFVWAACSSTQVVVQAGTGRILRGGCTAGPSFITAKAGTSMASPHVTGLAALLVEDFGRSPRRIKSQIQRSADDLGPRGTDPFYGRGRINVAEALGL